ncbi:glycosyltransferase family 4 protein [Methylophaga lonarensis]|uniref:glycosyltransferase family 4 protein n=1 Tax=Methylophaga lonarensis TaxID=999151 RepID=UPI003D2A2125
MRILHIDPDDIDNPLSGGGPIRTYEIYKRLSQRHEITVLTPTFEGSTDEKIRDGVRYLRLGRKIRNHGSSHHITFFFSLPAAIRRMEYDLLVEDFMPPFSATLNPLLAKAPVIGSVQWFFAKQLAQQYKLPFHLGERYGIKLYRNLLVLTEQMRQQLLARHPKANIKVIANGVDNGLFAEKFCYGDYILFLGRVDVEQKGVDLLLAAYQKIPQDKRLPLYLVGHSFQQQRIENLIAELDLAAWVKLPGKVTGEQKTRLIQDCRFVCVPSREETFGMVITEACASGKPVVLFDKSPMREVASPACQRVAPFDVDAYSQAMQDFIELTPEQMQLKSAVAGDWARQFCWDEIALQQEQFYQSVIEAQA